MNKSLQKLTVSEFIDWYCRGYLDNKRTRAYTDSIFKGRCFYQAHKGGMMIEQAPTLSLHERDRRWKSVRDLMRSQSLDCLIVGGFNGKEHYESYITDDYVEGVVIVPLTGEPTVLTWAVSRINRAQESFSRGLEAWVTDYRLGISGANAARVIREKGVENGRIGVVGINLPGPNEPLGFVPYPFWHELLGEMKNSAFTDVSYPFVELMLVKSQEEIALVRYAGQIGEKACQVMLEVTRPGTGEEVIFAEVMREIYRHAASARYPTLNLHSGPHNLSWGPTRWVSRAERPRRVEKGDIVQAEIFPCYGNQEIQVQMCIALDPVDEVNKQCEDVARRSYEVGLRVLKPGITLAELVKAMEEPLRESGCWALTPLFHSLSPSCLVGATSVNRDMPGNVQPGQAGTKTAANELNGVRHLTIRPGMTFAFEPNACSGSHRVNIGGTVIVTDSGCEEINELPTSVQHIS